MLRPNKVKKLMLNINFEESKVHFSLGCECKSVNLKLNATACQAPALARV